MAVGDWVPQVNYGQQVQLGVDPTGQFMTAQMILVQTGDDQGLVAEVGVVEEEREVLVKRVVGWVTFRMAFEEPHDFLIHERIRVGLMSDEGDLSFFAESLSDGSQANEPFLWERVSQIDYSTPLEPALWPQPDVGHPGWGQIDVRVARRLRRQDVLVYTVQLDLITANAPFLETDVATVFPFLRSWARGLG